MDCFRAQRRYDRVETLWEELAQSSPSGALVTEGRIVLAGALADAAACSDAIATLDRRADDVKRVQRAPPAPLVRARRPLRTRRRDPEGARAVRAGAQARRVVRRRRRAPRRAAADDPRHAARRSRHRRPVRCTHFLATRSPVAVRSRTGGKSCRSNLAVVRGVCSSPAEVRVLPSGSVLVQLQVTTRRRRGRGLGARRRVGSARRGSRSSTRATRSSSLGRVRRRFFRAGGSHRVAGRDRGRRSCRRRDRRRVQALRRRVRPPRSTSCCE